MFEQSRTMTIARALTAMAAALMMTAGSPPEAAASDVRGSVSSGSPVLLAQAGYDPGIAYLSGSQMSQYSRVGRISVQLVQKGSSAEVPFDQPFRTGDEFRFQVTSNKDGYLYILHRSPGGQFQVLYPPVDPKTGKPSGKSRVVKNQHYLVPRPGEGTFVFDAETGAETFYLVIKDRAEQPSLNDVIVSGGQVSAMPQSAAGYPSQPYPSTSSSPYDQYAPPSTAAGGSPYQQYPSTSPAPAGQYYEQPYQAPSTASSTQYPSQPAGGSPYGQQYPSPSTAPAGQYPSPTPGSGSGYGGYYEQPYQSPSAAASSPYSPQYGAGTQYQQQYPATSPSTQYPPQSPGAPSQYYEQPYQASPSAPAAQYPAQSSGVSPYGQQYPAATAPPASQYPSQPQYGAGAQYQQQYPAAAPPPPGQAPSQQMDKAKSELKQNVKMLALNMLNYSVIPRSAKPGGGMKYRGVSFKPESPGSDPGTYFAPQANSELQDAWLVFQLNHVR